MADDVTIKGLEFEIKGSSEKAKKGIDGLRDSLTGLKSVAKGGTGLDKAAKEAKEYGDAVSKSGTTARESVSEMNAAGKAATSLGQKIMSMKSAWKDLDPYASKASKDMREFGQTVKSDFGGVFSNLKEIIGESLSGVGEKISGSFGNVKEKLQPIADAVKPVFSQISETAKYTFATLAQPIVAVGQKMAPVFEGAFNGIKKGFEALPKVASAVAPTIVKVLQTIATAALSVVKAIGNLLVKALKTAFNAIKSVVKSIIQLPNKIKESITSGIENLRNKIIEVGKAAKEWFDKSLFTKPLRDAAIAASEFAKKLANIGNSLKRILFYRVIRTVIKQIGDAFKTGINNLYEWSQAIGGEFAAKMDMMSTSMLYFKNSIGAAVAPLINALAPALDFVIDKVVDFLNVINQLFARLTGASYWTRAIKQAASYGDAASSAGSAAKEAMRYLAPFDELNVLPDDSGRGSGGGSDASAGGGMFEEVVSFADEIKDFADQLKAAFENGDWQGVGETIADKLNEIVENYINWSGLGEKFGYWVNAIVQMEYWTLDKTHFDEIGKGIAKFINQALEEIDFETWGRLITKKFTSALDFAFGLLGNIDTTNIGDAVHDFFKGLFDEWTDWFQRQDWGVLADTLYTQVKGLFTGLAVDDIASSFFTALGTAFGSAAKFLGTFFGDIGKDLKDWFDSNLKGQTWKETGENILKWIGNGFVNIATWVDTNFITPFMQAIGAGDWWENLKTVGGDIWTKLKEGFPNAWNWAETNVVSPIRNALKTGNWSGVFSGENGIFTALGEGLGNIRTWVITNVINPVGKALFGDNWKDINPNGETLIEKFTAFIGDVGDWAKTNIIDPIVTELESYDWSALFSSLFEGAEQAFRERHPAAATFFFGVDDEGYERVTLSNGEEVFIPVTANVTSVNSDELTDEQRGLNTWAALKDAVDEIEEQKKTLRPYTAQIEEDEDNVDNKWLERWADLTKQKQHDEDYWLTHGADLKEQYQYYKDYWLTHGADLKEQYQYGSDYWLEHGADLKEQWQYYKDYWLEHGADLKEQWQYDKDYWLKHGADLKEQYQYGKDYWLEHGADLKEQYTYSKDYWIKHGADIVKTYNSVPDDHGVSVWLKAGADFHSVYDSLTAAQKKINVTANVTGVSGFTAQVAASGGIFSGGKWHNIAQYASGTARASMGQLFIAREAGPELVGTLKGHTAVMNNDQIVASVSAGVARAISGIEFHMNGVASAPIPIYNEDEQTEEAMYRAMVRALNEVGINVEVDLDGEVAYRNVVKRNYQNTRSTGVNQLAMA